MAPWSEPLTQPRAALYPALVAALTSSTYCVVALRTVSTSLSWSACPCGCVFCCARANEARARRAGKSIVKCASFFMFGFSLVLPEIAHQRYAGHSPKREVSQEPRHCRWFLPRMQSSQPPSFPKFLSIAKGLRIQGIASEPGLSVAPAKYARLA